MAQWILKHTAGTEENAKRWETEVHEELALAFLRLRHYAFGPGCSCRLGQFCMELPGFQELNGTDGSAWPRVELIDQHQIPGNQIADSQGVVWHLEFAVNGDPQRMELRRLDPHARKTFLPVHLDLAWSPT